MVVLSILVPLITELAASTPWICNVKVVDASNQRELTAEDAVVLNVSYNDVVVYVLKESYLPRLKKSEYQESYYNDTVSDQVFQHKGPGATSIFMENIDLSEKRDKSRFLTDVYYITYTRSLYSATVTIQTEATNYLSRKTVFKYTGNVDDIVIPLVPQKQNVELSGTVNLNQNDEKSKDTKNALQIYTAKEIADALKITEEEVIKLIKSGKLNGKLIGSTYFIRKEDFDKFMSPKPTK